MGQQRHLSTEAVILKISTSSEINKNFTFISPDLGIQQANAFGAAKIKSRFCSVIQTFTQANLFLYKSNKSDFYKLEDISNVDTNDFIREDLKFIYLTSFLCEVLLNCYLSTEEFKNYFYLLIYTIELLKEKKDIKKSFLFFVSKFLFLSGYNFNLIECIECKNKFDKYYFEGKKGGILCESHAKFKNFILKQNTALFWKRFLEEKYLILKDLNINDNDFRQLYPIITNLIRNIFEKELKTLKFIDEIIL